MLGCGEPDQQVGQAVGSHGQGQRDFGDLAQWDFTSLGNGDYKIISALGGLAASVVNCSDANGALLRLEPYTNQDCQQYHLDRANDGSLVFASLNGNRTVEVPFASTNPGTQLALFDYNGCTCQRWFLTNTALATAGSRALAGVSIFPSPATGGSFTVELGAARGTETTVVVTNLQGRRVHQQVYGPTRTTLQVQAALAPGIYVVQVRQAEAEATQKLTVQ